MRRHRRRGRQAYRGLPELLLDFEESSELLEDEDDADESSDELLDESPDALLLEPPEELLESSEEEEEESLSESESESELELLSLRRFFCFFWDFCAIRALSSASAAFLAAASLISGG